jgi:23S rRNA-/tRNA-specific pseudouridylate synthase
MSGQIFVHHQLYPQKSLKLPIIYDDEHCIAIVKPPGISCNVGPNSILGQMCENLRKSPVQNLGFTHPNIAYALDDGMSGVLLLSKNRESTDILRNLYGSNSFEFTFDLLCEKSSAHRNTSMNCSLPIAHHAEEDTMLISHKTGKKSHTAFRFIKNVGKYEHWQATCTYLRRDQIYLHAHESGLAILGDEVYGMAKIPPFTELKRNFKANRKAGNTPYFGTMANLSTLKLHNGIIIHGELPKKMHTFFKFLANPWEKTKF